MNFSHHSWQASNKRCSSPGSPSPHRPARLEAQARPSQSPHGRAFIVASIDINGKKLPHYIILYPSRIIKSFSISEHLRVVWCVWSFHVTRPSHFNTYKYIPTLSYLEARVYCSTLYQSPGKRSLAMEMAVPAASPVIMTWADTISNPGWPACPGNTVTNPSGSYYGFAIPLSPSVQVSCKCLAVLWYVLATHTWYVSGIDCQQGSTRYLYAT